MSIVGMRVRRNLGLLIGICCGALALAGCAQPAPGPDTMSPATPPAHAAVQVKVTLRQTLVHAGDAIHGTATVTNTTGTAITVHGCPNSWLMVGLTNGTIRFDPAIADMYCTSSIQLAPGVNTFPITVSTTYQECLGPQGHSLVPMPACDNGRMPPLPPGTYQTKVVTDGLAVGVDSTPVTVTLLP